MYHPPQGTYSCWGKKGEGVFGKKVVYQHLPEWHSGAMLALWRLHVSEAPGPQHCLAASKEPLTCFSL